MISISSEDKNVDPAVIEPGDIVNLIITVTSNIDASDLHIEIKVPDEVEVIAGVLNWRGQVIKHGSKVLSVQLRAPDSGKAEIKVYAVLPSGNGSALSMVSTFEFGKSKGSELIIKSPALNSSKGRGIIERIIKK